MTTIALMGTSVFAAEPLSPYEEQINEDLGRLTLKHRAQMMTGGVNGEWGQDNYYHHQTKAIPFKSIPFINLANGPMGVTNTPESANLSDGTHTSFGSGLVIAATWNNDLIYQVGQVLGEESLAKDVSIFEAPAININRDLLGGRTFEYFSEDPYLTSRVVVPYVEGVQSKNVAANVKHFMANNQETNRNNVSAHVTERAMHEIYLPGYQAAVEEADAWSVMTAANRTNGVYTSDNRYLLTNMLRYGWGFRGIVLTDWCNTRTGTIAAKAGLDLAMPGSVTSPFYYTRLLAEVAAGNLPDTVITQAAQNMLRVYYLTGALGDVEREAGSINTPEHQQVALQVAREGMVLLKNENSVLPIQKDSVQSIAVLGPHCETQYYQHGYGGSGATLPPYQVTYLEGLQKATEGTGISLYTADYNENNMEKTVADAVAAAEKADVAVLIVGIKNGWPYASETESNADSENFDRENLHFPEKQVELINAVAAANPNTVVLITGSVFELEEFIDNVPAAIQAFYPGMEQGTAAAEILFGDVNPSGKLPHTIPKRYEDTCAYTTASKQTDVMYDEGVYVGYRWNDWKNIAPRYAFGHGLSYTSFAYGDITLDKEAITAEETLTVSVPVTNTGDYDGAEVVQLYIHDPQASVDRPLKELKDFQKVFLQKGETKTVTFTLDKDALSYWDEEHHSFFCEAGAFEIWIGSASDDIRSTKAFTVTQSSGYDETIAVYQAETAVGSNVTVNNTAANHTGSGYLTFGGKNARAAFTVTPRAAGRYSLIVKYSNALSANATADVYVNGEKVGCVYGQSTHFEKSWNYDSVDADLTAGENEIEIVATNIAFQMDSLLVQTIDRVTELPAQIPDEIDPEQGVSANMDGEVYQAHEAVMTHYAIGQTYTGFTNIGYAAAEAGAAGSLTWEVTLPADDEYLVAVRYASQGSRPATLLVDGIPLRTYQFSTPDSVSDPWTAWSKEEFRLKLKSGVHTVTLQNETENGANIDYLQIYRDGTVYEAEDGTLGGGTTVANSRGGFTGTGYADFAGANSYVEFDIAVPTFGLYDIEIRYATTTDRPCNLLIDGQQVAQASLPATNKDAYGNSVSADAAWTNWQVERLKNVPLTTNNTKLRIASVQDGPNIDKICIRGGMVTDSDRFATTLNLSDGGFTPDGVVTGEMGYENNTFEDYPITLAVALYDDAGRLAAVSFNRQTIYSNQIGTLRAEVTVPPTGAARAEAFLWDGNTLKPLE